MHERKIKDEGKMIEIGRVCVKIAGRDARNYCVVIDRIDDNYALIDGNVRRKKCNILHLEPTGKIIKIKKNADTKTVLEMMKKEGIEIIKKGARREKKKQAKKSRIQEKKPAEEKKKEVKKVEEKKEETKKAEKKKPSEETFKKSFNKNVKELSEKTEEKKEKKLLDKKEKKAKK